MDNRENGFLVEEAAPVLICKLWVGPAVHGAQTLEVAFFTGFLLYLAQLLFMVVQAVLHQQEEEALEALFSHHLSKAKEGSYSLTEEHWAACLELSPARSNSIS